LKVIAHNLSLAHARIDTLEGAIEALSKCKRAKRTHVQKGGTLSSGEATDILTQREVDNQM
jgi:hypothetical protein